MVILKVLTILFVLSTYVVNASEITAVRVECPSETTCTELAVRAEGLLKGKDNRLDVEKAIEFLLLDQSIDRLAYEIITNEQGNWTIKLEVVPKVKIADIQFDIKGGTVDIAQAASLTSIKEGSFFEIDQVPEAKRILSDFLIERGYPRPAVEISTKDTEAGLTVVFKIDTGPGIIISSLAIKTDVPSFEDDIKVAFAPMLGANWNVGLSRQISEQLETSFFTRGFWSIDVDSKLIDSDQENKIEVTANFGPQYLFTFKGVSAFSRVELIDRIRDVAKSSNIDRMEDIVREAVTGLYETVGLYKIDLSQRSVIAKDRNGVLRTEIHIDITENQKTSLGRIALEGNQYISDQEFRDIVESECSVLVCRGYYDKKFLGDFSEVLRKKYLSSGFVMANVTSPEVRESEDSKLNVRYVVIENQRVEVSRIDLPGVPNELVSKITEKLKNKQGRPLDVTAVESDMNTALEVLREEGYFFARLTQVRDSQVVRYGRSFQTAQLVIPFDAGRKTYFDGLLVTGNNVTNARVIEREVDLKKGDLVTSREINKLRDRLVSLGLFASVTITPFLTQSSQENQYWLSFLVEVKERDFGIGELAPGYRTDLGPKASFQLAYNNWQGWNRTWAFKTQTNLRTNSSEFDARRASEDKRLLEYSAEVSYREPWLMGELLGTKIELDASTSYRRQRYFSFDADILRISPRLTKQFGDITTSVRYQFEYIRQFDASELKDSDSFQIGSITPSISYDRRDNPVIPTKGYFLGLSWEFANPYFLSQSRDDLIVNFNKLTSRNRFYYPVGNLVFALSVSAGYQRNFADDFQRDSSGNIVVGSDGQPLTQGYIPSIKVFRLDGVDNVRGFGDDEINRLPSGIDIGELRIQDTVTFVNYKFEPRYYINDNVAMGLFFDAGGLYVNQFVPFKVRTAMGLSAKLVTPVGSLDFDYGIKLKRRSTAQGGRESFGRFHLSIGSF